VPEVVEPDGPVADTAGLPTADHGRGLLDWVLGRADVLFATGRYTRGQALIAARDEARRILTEAVPGSDRGPRARCPRCGRWLPLGGMRSVPVEAGPAHRLLCVDCASAVTS
jgi:hypothetical protein